MQVKIIVSIVEAPLAFFEVKVKRVSRHAIELLQSALGKAPEALDAINVTRAKAEFVVTMLDSQVFGITNIDQSIVAAPTPTQRVPRCGSPIQAPHDRQ